MVGKPTVMDPIIPVGLSSPPKTLHFQGYKQSNAEDHQPAPQEQLPLEPPAPQEPPPVEQPVASQEQPVAQHAPQGSASMHPAACREVLESIRQEKSRSTSGEAALGVMAYWTRGQKMSPFPDTDSASGLVNGTMSRGCPDELPEWVENQKPKYLDSKKERETMTVLERTKDIFIKVGAIYSGRAMYRTIRNFDSDGDGIITGEEFRAALRRYGIVMTDDEFSSVMATFDQDHSNNVDLREFMTALRGNLSSMRMKAVARAFEEMDRDHSGEISLHECKSCYDPRVHPDVLSGKIDREQAMELFISQLDANSDGTITRQEFLNFFTDVSLTYDDDQQFVAHVRGMWRRRR